MDDFRDTEPLAKVKVNQRWHSRERRWGAHAHTVWRRFVWAHPVPIQFMIALASAGWALVALLRPETVTSGQYRTLLAWPLAEPRSWGLLFAAHALLSLWRIVDPVKRLWIGLPVNVCGFVLWGYVTAQATLFVGLRPSLAADLVVCLGAFACILKSGAAKEDA